MCLFFSPKILDIERLRKSICSIRKKDEGNCQEPLHRSDNNKCTCVYLKWSLLNYVINPASHFFPPDIIFRVLGLAEFLNSINKFENFPDQSISPCHIEDFWVFYIFLHDRIDDLVTSVIKEIWNRNLDIPAQLCSPRRAFSIVCIQLEVLFNIMRNMSSNSNSFVRIIINTAASAYAQTYHRRMHNIILWRSSCCMPKWNFKKNMRM